MGQKNDGFLRRVFTDLHNPVVQHPYNVGTFLISAERGKNCRASELRRGGTALMDFVEILVGKTKDVIRSGFHVIDQSIHPAKDNFLDASPFEASHGALDDGRVSHAIRHFNLIAARQRRDGLFNGVVVRLG